MRWGIALQTARWGMLMETLVDYMILIVTDVYKSDGHDTWNHRTFASNMAWGRGQGHGRALRASSAALCSTFVFLLLCPLATGAKACLPAGPPSLLARSPH